MVMGTRRVSGLPVAPTAGEAPRPAGTRSYPSIRGRAVSASKSARMRAALTARAAPNTVAIGAVMNAPPGDVEGRAGDGAAPSDGTRRPDRHVDRRQGYTLETPAG